MPTEEFTDQLNTGQLARETISSVLANQSGNPATSPEPVEPAAETAPVIPDEERVVDQAGEQLEELYKQKNVDTPEPTSAPDEKPIMVGDDEFTDDVYNELLGYGLDFGMPPSEVPSEMRPIYERMANSAISAITEHRMEQLAATQKTMQLEEFMKKVEENPGQLLQLMAVNKPEAFEAAVELFHRIQENPREKELLERELEVAAQQEAFNRRQVAAQRAEAELKAKRVQALVTRTARQYNVNEGVASQIVAMEIRNTRGREPTPQRVVQLISQLKPQTSTKSVSPEKLKAVQSAPTAPLNRQGAEPEPGTPPRPSASLEATDPLPIRSLIKRIGARIDAASRES